MNATNAASPRAATVRETGQPVTDPNRQHAPAATTRSMPRVRSAPPHSHHQKTQTTRSARTTRRLAAEHSHAQGAVTAHARHARRKAPRADAGNTRATSRVARHGDHARVQPIETRYVKRASRRRRPRRRDAESAAVTDFNNIWPITGLSWQRRGAGAVLSWTSDNVAALRSWIAFKGARRKWDTAGTIKALRFGTVPIILRT
jgi:hypothetical protein